MDRTLLVLVDAFDQFWPITERSLFQLEISLRLWQIALYRKSWSSEVYGPSACASVVLDDEVW